MAAIGGSAVGASALAAGLGAGAKPAGYAARPPIPGKTLVVQPVLLYSLFQRREAGSWRPWGGLHTESDIDAECKRIEGELARLREGVGVPVLIRPLARVTNMDQAKALRDGDADVMLTYAATGGGGELECLNSPDRHNLIFVRHKSGPVYLWYEIVHPHFLRKAVDEYGPTGLDVHDVVVDSVDELQWRIRALYGYRNTLGTRIIAIGSPSGWGTGGREAPKIAAEQWKFDMITIPYDDLGKRIESAMKEPERMKRAEAEAQEYLGLPGTRLQTGEGYVIRAFLLTDVFRDLMDEAQAPAMTINECMSTIMPMSQTTACLSLSVLNDEGRMAFCESDFVVIPSGVLLHHLSSLPVFLNDPTYPHDGVITLAHCTAPRKMDGKKLEKTLVLTHYESDYGAAPKVDMRIGQTVTVIDPDFHNKRWIGFRGKITENPFLDICRSQVDVSIEGDWRRLMEDMRGFHWMMVYGDHLQETGYCLRKLGVGWKDLTNPRGVFA